MDSYYILKEQSMKTCTYITDQSTNVHTKLSLGLGVNALFRLWAGWQSNKREYALFYRMPLFIFQCPGMVLPQVGAWVPNSRKYSRTRTHVQCMYILCCTYLVTVLRVLLPFYTCLITVLHVSCYCFTRVLLLFYTCLICFQCLRYSVLWLVLLHTGYLVLIYLVLPNLRSASSTNSRYFRWNFKTFSLSN